MDDKNTQPKSTIIIHALVHTSIEKNISMLAESENRSKSNMIETLLKEALEQRQKNLIHKT